MTDPVTSHEHTLHQRAGDRLLSYRREFDAPVDLVFRAHVDPALFARWIGPAGTTCRLDRFDATTGGSFDYAVVGGSQSFRFFGSYHEVATNERIVHTWEFAGDAGRPTLETLTFTALAGGRARLDGRSLYGTVEHCDEMFAFDQSGEGMDENFLRLDALLVELRATG